MGFMGFVSGPCWEVSSRRDVALSPVQARLERGEVVTVLGGTSGVAFHVLKKLSSGEFRLRAVARDVEKAKRFLEVEESGVEVVAGDVRELGKGKDLREVVEGSDAVVICTGTTAFPTKKWKDGNDPQAVEVEGMRNVLSAIPEKGGRVKMVVMVSSIGTQRRWRFPFPILNLFGVLDAKAEAEKLLKAAAREKGFQYVIVHAGRLVGGPFTNPGSIRSEPKEENRAVKIQVGDSLVGESSRESVAETIVQIMKRDLGDLEISMVNERGPDPDWDRTFDDLLGPKVALRLEFESLDEGRFISWLREWSSGVLTSGALFPPLPLAVQVRYEQESSRVDLVFLEISVRGEIQQAGTLELDLAKQPDGRFYFEVRRNSPDPNLPILGEEQVLSLLQDDLAKIVRGA